jgi:predicted dehydrogenase
MSNDAATLEPGSNGRKLRVAVVGCGTIGPRHAEAYAQTGQTELVGAVDIVSDRAAAFAERYGAAASYSSVADLLAEQHPDLVTIATPPGTHAELAEQVLAAGCSVLLEKPPCPTLSQLDAVAAAEAKSSGQVYVVFQHRHGSGAQRARQLIERGALGQPQVAVCETLWFRPVNYFDPEWRGTWAGEGGGPTLGHGIHQIDLLLYLLGPWTTLTALAARVARPVEFEDVSLASVIFDNGSVASMTNSLLSPRELSRIRLDLTGGTLEVDHVYGYADQDWSFTPAPDEAMAAKLGRDPGVRDGSGELAEPTSETPAVDPWEASAGTDVPSNHGAQIARLVDDLQHGRTHETTLASTRPTMEFVTAVYASALLGVPVRRDELVPGHPFYDDLSGGLRDDQVTSRVRTDAQRAGSLDAIAT